MITKTVERIKAVPGFSRWQPRTRLVALVLGAVLAIGTFSAAGVAYFGNRADDDVRAASQEATEVAKTVVPKILTYAPETVDQDLDTAAGFLTGEFRDKFTSMAGQVIAPAAHSEGIKTTAAIAATSVVSAASERVSLLLFVNQTTTTAADPTPKIAGSRVKVVMERSGDTWKVNELTPM